MGEFRISFRGNVFTVMLVTTSFNVSDVWYFPYLWQGQAGVFIEGQALNEENKAKFISHQCVFYSHEKTDLDL